MPDFLGIEIGGTKLQLGVGNARQTQLRRLERRDVDRKLGAAGIRRQIEAVGQTLLRDCDVDAIGVGFGGPVDVDRGRCVTSFHVEGWDRFPLAQWCAETFGKPSYLANDADAAGMGEAMLGAGAGYRVVFYSNSGSGIGGALVADGQLYLGGQGGAAEIGHLRPGMAATDPDQTVEAVASGWGIAARARRRLKAGSGSADADDLLDRCGGDLERLTARLIADAWRSGNKLAQAVFEEAICCYGWALAQAVTLLSPNIVVLGGGLTNLDDTRFLVPLRKQIKRYVMPVRHGSYQVVRAVLGEQVVVHGAIAIAAQLRSTVMRSGS